MQVCIISIPPLANIFGVHALTMRDWGFVLLLSIIPLVVNEIIKLVKKLKGNEDYSSLPFHLPL